MNFFQQILGKFGLSTRLDTNRITLTYPGEFVGEKFPEKPRERKIRGKGIKPG